MIPTYERVLDRPQAADPHLGSTGTPIVIIPTEAPGAHGAAVIARHRIGLPEREGVGER